MVSGVRSRIRAAADVVRSCSSIPVLKTESSVEPLGSTAIDPFLEFFAVQKLATRHGGCLRSTAPREKKFGGNRRGEPAFGSEPSRRRLNYFNLTVFVTIGDASPC